MPAGRLPRTNGLPPLIGDAPHVLILGSFPSRQSLETGQYYANPQNRFWAVMEALFGIGRALPYKERTALLLHRRIALYDAVGSCRRAGSADSRIRNPVLNDIAGLLARHPTIRLVACNGSAAATYASGLRLPDSVPLLRLPSTSPAYAAMSLEDRIARWSVLSRYI